VYYSYHSNPQGCVVFTVNAVLRTDMLNRLNSVSIETVRDVKSYNKCSKSTLSALTRAHNCFPTRSLPCR